jgi:hypothetical protein
MVQITVLSMLNTRQDLAFGGTIGPKYISHAYPRHVAQALQQLAEEGSKRFCRAIDRQAEI